MPRIIPLDEPPVSTALPVYESVSSYDEYLATLQRVVSTLPPVEAEVIDDDEEEVEEDEEPRCFSCSGEGPLEEFDGDELCEECLDNQSYVCDCCAERVSTYDTITTTAYDGEVCQHCYDNAYFNCDSCDNVLEQGCYAGNGECESCYEPEPEEDEEEDRYPVRQYNFDVTRVLPLDKGRRLFGVELEVATEHDVHGVAVKTQALIENDAILKSDGSIETGVYQGFEIVTRPMTLTHQVEFWEKFLEKCDRGLRSYDVGTCGLHIHVTRKSLSPLTIGKLLVFLNNPAHETFIRRIAQRYNSGYSRAKEKKLADFRYNEDRYEFLNLQNSKTVEFRLFRGTLNRQRLLACLEFTDSLIRFCESTSIQANSAEDFKLYLAKQPKTKNLKNLLAITAEQTIENPIIAVDGRD